MTYQGWKPKLTPAKLRALAHVDRATTSAGILCEGTILTSCHALEMMGLVRLSSGHYHRYYSITPAGRKALADPNSFKPFRV